MKNDEAAVTRESLLCRLRQHPADRSAWDEFVARYQPMILGWCRHWGLQDADAQDVSQLVLVRLAVKMRTFAYDPGRSFRAWLKTLARHAWSDFTADQARNVARGCAETSQHLSSIEARADLEKRLAEAYDMELLEIATVRVKQRVAEQTWRAFQLTAIEGLCGADVAVQLGMNVANVFKAKSNVQSLLRAEVHRIDRGEF